jgi:hypothetical protein
MHIKLFGSLAHMAGVCHVATAVIPTEPMLPQSGR